MLNLVPRMSASIASNVLMAEPGSSGASLRPVRLTDLSMICGLPIETVRRILKKLQSRGKIDQTSNGMWCMLDHGVDKAAMAFTHESMADFKRVAELLDQLGNRNS